MKNIKYLFKNELAGKILLFFNENPHCIDTAKGVSIWLGCDAEKAQKSMDELVTHGILINHKALSTDAYSYTNKRVVIKKVEKYIKNLRNA